MTVRHKTVWQPLSSKRHYTEFLLPLKSQFRGLLFLYSPGYLPPILPKLELQKFYCFAAPSVDHGPVVSTSLVNSDNLGLHPRPTKPESASNKMSWCFISKLVIGKCWAPRHAFSWNISKPSSIPIIWLQAATYIVHKPAACWGQQYNSSLSNYWAPQTKR